MQARVGTMFCNFGGDRFMFVVEVAIFVKSEKCPYYVTFDLDLTLTLSTRWMRALLGTIMCKFGGDRVMFVVEVATCV